MSIILKKDWDLSVSPPSRNPSGHFAGRKKEISQLINEILRRNSGAILVSGHRGVGKTSMVYQAINTAIDKEKEIVVVLMNAAQLEEDSEKKDINPKKIIENLIRRLYSVSVNKPMGNNNKKIEELYKKAVAKETELKEFVQKINDNEKTILEEKNFQARFNEIDKNTITFLISWALAVSYQVGNFNIFNGGIWDKLIPLFLSFPIPYIFNFTFNRTQITKDSKRQSQEVAEIYKFDNAIGNLEFDLEHVHSAIAYDKYKLVYIIDELDKLEVDQVKSILKYFKNLFTLSDAIFIFIGGEELFLLGGSDNLGNRDKEYTYFTSRYYLSRPRWEDLSQYLDSIILNQDISPEELECFKRALCFDAGNDFFDIKSQIRDKIASFNKDNLPVINYKITDSDLRKSRLHRALTILYENQYMYLNPLSWRENENLLRSVFTKAHEVERAYVGDKLDDPRGKQLTDQLIRDFNKLMLRLDVFRIHSEAAEVINNISVPIRTYVVSGKTPSDPPFRVADPTEFERRFIEAFEDYCELIVLFYNLSNNDQTLEKMNREKFLSSPDYVFGKVNSLGANFQEIFATQNKLYKNIVGQIHPYPYQREQVEENTNTIVQFYNDLLHSQARVALPRLIKQRYASEPLEIASFNNNSQVFSDAASVIRSSVMEARIPSEVIFRNDLSRQILVIADRIDIFHLHKSIIKDVSQTHRIVCLSNGSEKESKVPNLIFIDSSSRSNFEHTVNEMLSEIDSFLYNVRE